MKKQCFYLALLAISAFFAFLSACGEGDYKNLEDTLEWGDIELELGKITDPNSGMIKGCAAGNIPSNLFDSLCVRIEQGQSPPLSSAGPPITQSSSSDGGGNTTYTPTCTGLAETWIAGTAITKPSVKCNGTDVPNPVFSQAPSWDNPVEGVYNVSVTLDCGGSQQIGCGTLVVDPAPTASELSCLVSVSTGVAGTPIPKPTVKCGTTEVTNPTFTTTLNWDNPVAGSYTVTANPPSTGDCKQAAAKSCGTGITVSPKLTCSSVTQTIPNNTKATKPTVTCGSATLTTGITFNPNLDNNLTATVPSVTVNATAGDCKDQQATCAGTITVSPPSSSSAAVSSSSAAVSSSSAAVSSSSAAVSSSSAAVSSSSTQSQSSSSANNNTQSSSSQGNSNPPPGGGTPVDITNTSNNTGGPLTAGTYTISAIGNCTNIRFNCNWNTQTVGCSIQVNNGTLYEGGHNSSNNVINPVPSVGATLTVVGTVSAIWCASW